MTPQFCLNDLSYFNSLSHHKTYNKVNHYHLQVVLCILHDLLYTELLVYSLYNHCIHPVAITWCLNNMEHNVKQNYSFILQTRQIYILQLLYCCIVKGENWLRNHGSAIHIAILYLFDFLWQLLDW